MISSYANFAGVGCMRDVIALEIKKEYNFKCWAYVNHQINKAENRPGIDLNYESLEIVEKLCYFDNTIGAGGGSFDSATTRIRKGWCRFRDLVSWLASRGFHLGSKGVMLDENSLANEE